MTSYNILPKPTLYIYAHRFVKRYNGIRNVMLRIQ